LGERVKQHLVLGAVGALVLGPAATVAAAEPVATERVAVREVVGKVIGVKSGKLHVAQGKKRVVYVFNADSSCASNLKGKLTILPCVSLGQKPYRAKTVQVRWYRDAKKRRIAAAVLVGTPWR
jgi:hypothetical protein